MITRADDRAALADVQGDVARQSRGAHFADLRRLHPSAGDTVLRLQARRLAAIDELGRCHRGIALFVSVGLTEALSRGYLATAEQLKRRD